MFRFGWIYSHPVKAIEMIFRPLELNISPDSFSGHKTACFQQEIFIYCIIRTMRYEF
jgi:hypothetical protein